MRPALIEAYRVLDLEPGADLAAVRQSYRILVKVWHPDRFSQDQKLQESAGDKLKQINAAYKTVTTYLENTPDDREPVPRRTRAEKESKTAPTVVDIYQMGLDRLHSRDYDAALTFFIQAAEMGYANAQYAVGFLYYQHTVRNIFTLLKQYKNDNAAFEWWTESAEQGHADAQYMLGLLHLYAYCTPYNEREARRWLERAASQGHYMAKERVAKLGVLHKFRAIPFASLVMEPPPAAPEPTRVDKH